MKVRRGDIVNTWGPHSNGHMEQVALVTNVYGEGDEAGVPVNLHVFVDLGGYMLAGEVPFYQSRQHAIAALYGDTGPSSGGAVVAWPLEQKDE
jgi:hypothetical protein